MCEVIPTCQIQRDSWLGARICFNPNCETFNTPLVHFDSLHGTSDLSSWPYRLWFRLLVHHLLNGVESISFINISCRHFQVLLPLRSFICRYLRWSRLNRSLVVLLYEYYHIVIFIDLQFLCCLESQSFWLRIRIISNNLFEFSTFSDNLGYYTNSMVLPEIHGFMFPNQLEAKWNNPQFLRFGLIERLWSCWITLLNNWLR